MNSVSPKPTLLLAAKLKKVIFPTVYVSDFFHLSLFYFYLVVYLTTVGNFFSNILSQNHNNKP